MPTIKEGGSFETFNDPRGNPLISINRDGTISTIGIDFADGTKQTTAATGGGGGTPGAPVNSVQGNKAGVFAGIVGSVIDFVNGLLTLAPTGHGVALTVKGDDNGNNIINALPNDGVSPGVSVTTPGHLLIGGTIGNVGVGDATAALTVTGDQDGSQIASFQAGTSGNEVVSIAPNVVAIEQPAYLTITTGILQLLTPATKSSATSAGMQGQISWDAGFIYVCTVQGSAGAATWKKVALVAAP